MEASINLKNCFIRKFFIQGNVKLIIELEGTIILKKQEPKEAYKTQILCQSKRVLFITFEKAMSLASLLDLKI